MTQREYDEELGITGEPISGYHLFPALLCFAIIAFICIYKYFH